MIKVKARNLKLNTNNYLEIGKPKSTIEKPLPQPPIENSH